MKEKHPQDESKQAYNSYEEFRARFYDTTNAEVEKPSFGKNLAKQIVDKISNSGWSSKAT